MASSWRGLVKHIYKQSQAIGVASGPHTVLWSHTAPRLLWQRQQHDTQRRWTHSHTQHRRSPLLIRSASTQTGSANARLIQLCRDGDMKQAWKEFCRLADSKELNIASCANMLQLLDNAGEAPQFVAQVFEAAVANNVPLDERGYGQVVWAYYGLDDAKAARSTVGAMIKSGIMPSLDKMHEIFMLHLAFGDLHCAVRLLQLMHRRGLQLEQAQFELFIEAVPDSYRQQVRERLCDNMKQYGTQEASEAGATGESASAQLVAAFEEAQRLAQETWGSSAGSSNADDTLPSDKDIEALLHVVHGSDGDEDGPFMVEFANQEDMQAAMEALTGGQGSASGVKSHAFGSDASGSDDSGSDAGDDIDGDDDELYADDDEMDTKMVARRIALRRAVIEMYRLVCTALKLDPLVEAVRHEMEDDSAETALQRYVEGGDAARDAVQERAHVMTAVLYFLTHIEDEESLIDSKPALMAELLVGQQSSRYASATNLLQSLALDGPMSSALPSNLPQPTSSGGGASGAAGGGFSV